MGEKSLRNKNSLYPSYDLGYKSLFEVKEIFSQFMDSDITDFNFRQFLTDKIIINVSLYSENSRTIFNKGENRNDLVWKVEYRKKDNSTSYFLVVLEFQSSIDKLMPQRISEYSILIIKKISNSESIYSKFPPIISFILYNGDRKWNISENIYDLFDDFPHQFSDNLIRHRYYVIDIRHFNKDINNFKPLIKFIFWGENIDNFNQYCLFYGEVCKFFQKNTGDTLLKAFLFWIESTIWKRYAKRWKDETSYSEVYKNMEELMKALGKNPFFKDFIDQFYDLSKKNIELAEKEKIAVEKEKILVEKEKILEKENIALKEELKRLKIQFGI